MSLTRRLGCLTGNLFGRVRSRLRTECGAKIGSCGAGAKHAGHGGLGPGALGRRAGAPSWAQAPYLAPPSRAATRSAAVFLRASWALRARSARASASEGKWPCQYRSRPQVSQWGIVAPLMSWA